jgi:isopentenyl diphosphate isomerase/L-lactate dehydrogenase-like FMN-dependent dehydrogenase
MRPFPATNLDDLETTARRRLPRPVFDLIAGGGDDELNLRRNRSAFAALTLHPRLLADVSQRDMSTTVLGRRMTSPIMLAPTGAARVLHREAELAVASAADDAGLVYVQSAISAFPAATIAQRARRPLWYQLYVTPERDRLKEDLRQIAGDGYEVLVVTLDTPVLGHRERDIRNRVTLPVRIGPKVLAQVLLRPKWAIDYARTTHLPGQSGRVPTRTTQSQIAASAYPVTEADLRRVRDLWPGPLVVKGVLTASACESVVRAGADGVIVSNHGGRQLDGTLAPIEALPEVVAVAGGMPVMVDGGIRRGTDVAKAIALGAQAVLIGRPYLYGLAVAGQAGVAAAISILTSELDRTMALLGAATVKDLTADLVRRPSVLPLHRKGDDAADGGVSPEPQLGHRHDEPEVRHSLE